MTMGMNIDRRMWAWNGYGHEKGLEAHGEWVSYSHAWCPRTHEKGVVVWLVVVWLGRHASYFQ